jgi:peptidoglycan L-alanyl-D-glutamate endopeptidase CwlK
MTLQARDRQRLAGVHTALVGVVEEARSICAFVVVEGLRTHARQAQLVQAGASRTMRSRHLTGHAVDLAFCMDTDRDGRTDAGEVRWDWPLVIQVADAMRAAALRRGVALVWGAVWDRELAEIPGPLDASLEAYAARARAQERLPFLDGPHFELCPLAFPAG